jgi:microcystin-dependent protein
MAETTTPRLGIRRWSADTDTPSRAEFDADHAALDNLVAIDQQGLLADRPAAGVRGRYYWSTDISRLDRDTGSAWVVVGPAAQAFPVGSVFIGVVSTNPATLLGYGTWSAFGAGRVLVGFDAAQAEFDVVEEVGGAKTHALVASEMPGHTHAIDHDHVAVTSGAGSSHTHAIDHDHLAVTSGVGSSHSHTVDHNHAAVTSAVGSSHSHGDGTLASASAGAHVHSIDGEFMATHAVGSIQWQTDPAGAAKAVFPDLTTSDGAHSHDVTGSTASEAAHTHSVDLPNFTGSSGGEATHTHSVDLPNFTGSSGGEAAHTHSVNVAAFTGASGSTGGGGAHNNLQPYIVCYFWKRTA